MPEPQFAPYVPRRLRAGAAQPAQDAGVRPCDADEASCEADRPVGAADARVAAAFERSSPELPAQGLDGSAHLERAIVTAAAENGLDAATDGEEAEASLGVVIANAERLADIRNEAVRLAAVACGKALRRAMLVDPAQLARFVDDALSEAQAPDSAVVRLNPKDVDAGAPPDHDTIADPCIAPGEFAIETPSGAIDGNPEERAALLVLAALHASR